MVNHNKYKYQSLFLSAIMLVMLLFSCKLNNKQYLTLNSLSELESVLNSEVEIRLSGKIYNLKGKKLKIKNNIKFEDGAKIINGTLIGDKSRIDCPNLQCFDNVEIQGTWTNKESHISWFTNGKDAYTNFLALTYAATLSDIIYVDKLYTIASLNSISFDTPNGLIIKGKTPETSGFILETKHQNGNAYFRSEKGNNIDFENISITTKDYQEGKLPHGNDYIFASSVYSPLYPKAQPDMSFFRLENCWLKGAVHFEYNISPENTDLKTFKSIGISEIRIKNSRIDGAVTTLRLSNVPYKTASIENNTITNLHGATFFFPIGGINENYADLLMAELRPLMILKNNKIRNDKPMASIGDGYLSFVVAKGRDFEVIDNTIENVLNTKNGIETIPFYCSASNHLLVKGNKVINVGSKGLGIGFGSNCLLKFKGALKCDVENNEFRFNRKGLLDLGLISSETVDLNTIPPEQFRFSIWGADLLNRNDQSGYYNIQNNIFEAAIISDYSFASRTDMTLIENEFLINHILTSDPNSWNGNLQNIDHTLFYMREPIVNGHMLIERNLIRIQSMGGKTFYFTNDINDNKNYQEVIYKDNVFEVNGTVSLAYPRSVKLISKNELIGKGSITYNGASTSKKNRVIELMESEQLVKEYYSTTAGPYHLKNFGLSKIVAKKNKDCQINILQVLFNDLYFYNDIDHLPVTLEIEVKLVTNSDKQKTLKYQVIFESYLRAHFIEEITRIAKFVKPYWEEKDPDFHYLIHPINNVSDPIIKLALVSQSKGTRMHKTGYLILEGTEHVESFEVTARVEKFKSRDGDESISKFIDKTIDFN